MFRLYEYFLKVNNFNRANKFLNNINLILLKCILKTFNLSKLTNVNTFYKSHKFNYALIYSKVDFEPFIQSRVDF